MLDAEEVRGLEIAMNDAEDVGLGERFACLQHEIDRLLDRQRPVFLQPVGEIGAFEVLHDDVRSAVFELSYVRHPRDVLAFDLHRRLCFSAEAGHRVAIFERVGKEELQGDLLIELKVMGGHHDSHSPFAENPIDTVLAREHLAAADVAMALLRHEPGARSRSRSTARPTAAERSPARGIAKLLRVV